MGYSKEQTMNCDVVCTYLSLLAAMFQSNNLFSLLKMKSWTVTLTDRINLVTLYNCLEKSTLIRGEGLDPINLFNHKIVPQTKPGLGFPKRNVVFYGMCSMVVCYVNIGRIVDHDCLSFLIIIIVGIKAI